MRASCTVPIENVDDLFSDDEDMDTPDSFVPSASDIRVKLTGTEITPGSAPNVIPALSSSALPVTEVGTTPELDIDLFDKQLIAEMNEHARKQSQDKGNSDGEFFHSSSVICQPVLQLEAPPKAPRTTRFTIRWPRFERAINVPAK